MGTRYPKSRTGWPRELEGRHVRKEEKGFREGDPECLRQAHQSRKGHGPEDAGAGRPRASRAMLGGDAEALLDAYGLEGRAHRKTRPDAEPHREGARRKARRPAGLA